MPSNEEQPSQTNGTGNNLNEGNVNNVPSSSNGAERFSQSSTSDEPYFARARMEGRSDHLERLAAQLKETDELLKN
ncbi:hypothetical protein BJY04DRAFT_214100 [Aspergillus karnatakaensis]|uniref:uncharacterized protein n=1 Tax=Aspergillus karnatakaensis TaxID=1810916 RepID=UPI003CCD56A1